MSSIVVGISRSDTAWAIAAVADRFAGALGLELMLVHATTGADSSSDVLDRADPRYGLGSRRCVGFSDPADALARVAQEDDAALLVIGTGAHKPIRALFRRSTANSIVRAATCPVLLVSPAAATRERAPRPRTPSAIVCAIEESSKPLAIADYASALADVTRMRLVLVRSAAPTSQEPPEELPEQAADLVIRSVDRRPSEWLEVIGDEENAALAVIGADEPPARSIASWATRPVLVLSPGTVAKAIETLRHLEPATWAAQSADPGD
jgi:Universal stress protein family